jgi:hypothetical protein
VKNSEEPFQTRLKLDNWIGGVLVRYVSGWGWSQ